MRSETPAGERNLRNALERILVAALATYVHEDNPEEKGQTLFGIAQFAVRAINGESIDELPDVGRILREGTLPAGLLELGVTP